MKNIPQRFVAIDFETANEQRQSACSIGITVIENSKVIESFAKLIKPTPEYYAAINVSIHGITKNMTSNAPTFDQIWPEIKHYFEGQNVIAHNAAFDFSVLRSLFEEYGIEYPTFDYYCTMHISKKVYPDLFNYQLSTLCKEINFKLNHHDAQSDAEGCAMLMLDIFSKWDAESFDDLAGLLKFKAGNVGSGTYRAFKSKVR